MSSLGFYQNLKKPFFVLAPMEEVTDNAFREIICKYGKPDITYTEFTSADGLCSIGRDRVIHRLEYNETQRPIVAQLFTKFPEKMKEAAILCRELGFDGIDINMGCPEKNVCQHGCGSAMIRTPELAVEIIKAAQEGAEHIPVSVKTRIGYSRKDELEDWEKYLLDANPVKITFHGRTKKEMSKVPADWDAIGRAVEIRNKYNPDVLISGNGDVKSIEEAEEKARIYKVDGVMIGRGIFGNPWLFNKEVKKENLSLEEILKVLLEHAKLYHEYYDGKKPFHTMRKHFKSYISGFPDMKELREKLLEVNSFEETEGIINKFMI